MKVIVHQQGFFDFLFGISENSIDIPDREVGQIVYYQDVYDATQGGPLGKVKMKNGVEIEGILIDKPEEIRKMR